MPVPSDIADLSQTAGNNSPPGSESPTTADDYLRAQAAFIAMLRDGKGFSGAVQLASGSTTDLGAQNALFVEVTGTTTITSFGTNYNGPRFLRFTGALTLTHNATSLVLPGGANITTAAGDCAIAVPNQAGNGWNVVQFMSAADSGQLASSSDVQTGTSASKAVTPAALRGGALVSGTPIATTSGALHDFTSIPSWVKRITVMFSGVSTNGSSLPVIRIGDSGGVESTGYSGSVSQLQSSVSDVTTGFTSSFGLTCTTSAADAISGVATLTLIDPTTNTWAFVAQTTFAAAALTNAYSAGAKTLSATLDRVRLTTLNGTDTFDGGLVNILYE
jgi:hypothetical protein